ncbi:MAG: hypothetical protein ABI927_07180 [Gaiellaceae bacterium]
MTETVSVFANVIKDHLELKAKNADLDGTMPINRYTSDDPFENHPLFKSEEQARLEETMDGSEPAVELHSATLPWPGEAPNGVANRGTGDEVTLEHAAEYAGAGLEDGLWSRTRDFDWGD